MMHKTSKFYQDGPNSILWPTKNPNRDYQTLLYMVMMSNLSCFMERAGHIGWGGMRGFHKTKATEMDF